MLLKPQAIPSAIIILSWLLLHPCEAWLREDELSEVATTKLEAMKESFA